jgi:hypothetical protein
VGHFGWAIVSATLLTSSTACSQSFGAFGATKPSAQTNVIENIQHNWVPNCTNPQQVTVSFRVLASGYLDGEPEISGSSDNSAIQSVLMAIHKAEPLKLPTEMVGRKIRVHFNAAEPCR